MFEYNQYFGKVAALHDAVRPMHACIPETAAKLADSDAANPVRVYGSVTIWGRPNVTPDSKRDVLDRSMSCWETVVLCW